METMCYYIHALTALHAGTGQGVGVVDLPIAREKSTGLPIVPGSGIKGVLREELNPSNPGTDDLQPCKDEHGQDRSAEECWLTLFGPDAKNVEAGKEGSGFAGALNIQDAQLLCLPVRSVYGVFAWVTCPFILQRYQRDLDQVPDAPPLPEPLCPPDGQQGLVTSHSKIDEEKKVFLEDLDFQVTKGEGTIDDLAAYIAKAVFPVDTDEWRNTFIQRFLIIPDNVFSFLAETATEVRARIRIEPGTRTVADGQLWYEENLPAETLLWGIIGCDRSRSEKHAGSAKELIGHFQEKIGTEKSLQIGGNATVGRGRVRWIPGPVGG
ncbi:MAG: type III-B CRISPR module RAMP protein Cmr4 [Candidatus Electrothrix communis]|nr:MAG: type III-B CRISPR module RAMP protein Cmr4 [Candidatus Electrothrix communis]